MPPNSNATTTQGRSSSLGGASGLEPFPGTGSVAKPSKPGTVAASAPVVDYDTHYRTHANYTPAQLWVDVSFLRQLNRFPEVERALKAYLKYHGKNAEAWVYLLLAVAFEVNGRPTSDVRTALGWAGYLARKQGDPFTLVEVADILILRELYEIPLPNNLPTVSAGELLDTAQGKAPNRPEPILLSMLLAEKTKDPERMGRAADQLLELAWPGVDELWRKETRRRVESMAKELAGAGDEAAGRKLLDRLERADTRDLFLRLTWKGNAGIDLVVEEPLGATARFEEPRTVFGGSITKSGRGASPESTYSCPRGFDGDYKVRLEKLYNDENDPARDITLEVITHEGLPEEHKETYKLSLDQASPVVITLKGGRRTKVLPLQPAPQLADVPNQKPGNTRDGAGKPTSAENPTAKAAEALRASSRKSSAHSPAIKPGTTPAGRGDRP